LSELEQEGLITKKVYPEIHLKVEYRLTTKAKDLEPILQSVDNWCEKWELKNKK
jgi:DNA-binding HxlR family transcriptional regulator